MVDYCNGEVCPLGNNGDIIPLQGNANNIHGQIILPTILFFINDY
jgi:hypothetical protein